MAIRHFLLIFDHSRSELDRVQEFGTNSKAAVKAYEAAEAVHRDNNLIDVVLVGSDSLDTVRVTHANYFTGGFPAEESVASKYLAGL